MAVKLAPVIRLSLMTTFIICCSSETTTSGTINWWCTQTPHYHTCNHYVAQRIFSDAIISATQFLNMTVQAAVDDAGVVLKQVHGIESEYPNVPGKSLWGSCVDYFNGTVFTLNMVLDPTLRPTPLDVQTWLSAGLAYINVCEKGFEFINLNNTMIPTISTNLTQLILNSLAISVLIRGIDSDNPTFVNWKLPELTAGRAEKVVVAKDGSGDFTTVQGAVNFAGRPTRGSGRCVIYVKAGIYEENVVIPQTVENVWMFGDGIHKTIITGDRHSGGDMVGTPNAGDLKDSATIQVWGRGFSASYITFRNTAGPQGGQAIALLSGSDQSTFYHCSIEGYQDTLFTISGKQFYKQCHISGTVDFIFGDALAVFQDCIISLRKPPPGGGLVITAHGRRYHNESTGYSLQGCKINAAGGGGDGGGGYKAFLGRPWFPYGLTVYMQSFLDELIDPKGWLDSWGFNETAFFGEFKNHGPGSSTRRRVKWRGYHIIKDVKIARHFTVANFISGNQWLPGTGVPFTPGLEN